MKRTSIGLCVLAFTACEAAQGPAVIQPVQPVLPETSRAEEDGPSASLTTPDPVVVAPEATEVVPEPEIGKVQTKKLTAKAGPKRDVALLEKHCRVVDNVCDVSSIELTVDGLPVTVEVPDAGPDAPYGEWAYLSVFRSDEDMLMLSMKFSSYYHHMGLVLREGVFEIKNNTKWPAEIRGELISANDWKAGAVHFRCDAFAMGRTPTDCKNLEILVGDEVLFREYEIVSSKIEAKVLPAKKQNALRISTTPVDGEWTPLATRVFAKANGKTVPVWDSASTGKHDYADDGSWEVTESECQKPATLDYDDNTGEEIVKKHGRESFTRRRFVWNGNKVQSRVVKRWTDRRSSCQTEGRCPHVYAGAESQFLGEILRNRVGKAAWANEFVEVPRSLIRNGTLEIRLAEEKNNERTFVDSVWLLVGDRRIEPRGCIAPICERDGNTLSMDTGDEVRFSFSNIPETGTVRFFASGYYVYKQ